MCGICGLLGPDSTEAAIKRMLGLMAHRGPDHQGLWSGEGAALGHTRLSIVDTSPKGHQPMLSEDGKTVLAANGEIYNSPQIRQRLERQGHRFISRSDNEVLLHSYEQSGGAFLPELNAMFAMAIWDSANRRLLLARDRLGIKPLYFCHKGEHLAFASEIKALLSLDWAPKAISPRGLSEYLGFENTFGSRTLHQGIEMLRPGEYLVFENGGLKRAQFWQPGVEEVASLSFDQAVEAYREEVEGAVKRHMMSDVEVASYLSSGFDSSTVATLATGFNPEPLATYCGAFDAGGWYDESKGAGAVAQKIGSRHTTVSITASDFTRVFDDLIFALDEPRMGPGSFSQYIVAKEAARRGKVILTGHGGDELFGGYPVFKFIRLWQEMGTSPRAGLRHMSGIRPSEFPHLAFFYMQQKKAGGRGVFLPRLFSRGDLKKALRPEWASLLAGLDPVQELRELTAGENDLYRLLTRTYLQAYLPGLFVVEDKISMAHSLESRTPLCDNQLVELGLKIPLSLKLDQGELKAIPKTAMKARLPELLYRLPKRGFPTPIGLWFRRDCRAFVEKRLLGKDSRLNRLFRSDYLRSFWKRYQMPGRERLGPLDVLPTHRVWMLLCLEGWLRAAEERLGVELNLG
ncbi:asparagine synthase (glutamine-hydrolyzing) [Dethiosulfatarculus sandiegensis]|uniref:asparagine synthase (glutamine-hydrolyzing) n=1 Tax=Dethiosulfatarculus sandiegensis TaxID=1429043 RepID=A0A0D2GET2_9BACT|nr:asparagine synthase (glutamine-hydrolyzing) [Dethiosulfatarculus sandiegensis]KIX13442.1 hypothetical protein X474_14530 [Dethiosulfatarculus sandiegensis]